MKTFSVTVKKGAETCRIECRKGALRALSKKLGGRQAFVFTDENVLRLYGRAIARALPSVPVMAMRAGEEYKTPQTLFDLLEKMAQAALRRDAVLIAVGGGVVGDIGGLAAGR